MFYEGNYCIIICINKDFKMNFLIVIYFYLNFGKGGVCVFRLNWYVYYDNCN